MEYRNEKHRVVFSEAIKRLGLGTIHFKEEMKSYD